MSGSAVSGVECKQEGLNEHPWGGSGVEHYIRGGVTASCVLDLLVRESNIYLQSVVLKSRV